jgi:S1-C subfamily serine protease
VVEPGGLILTSALLVQEADAIVVTTLDSRTVTAAVAAHDPALGIAVLRPAAPLGVRPLPVGHSATLEPRAWVSVASAALQRTVSVATVVDKRDFAGDREYLVEDAIFTAPLVHECAGAALVDGTGKLIGVGALAVKEIRGPDAALGPGNVFIPVERFQPVLSHLARADGSSGPRRPWLGLVTQRRPGGDPGSARQSRRERRPSSGRRDHRDRRYTGPDACGALSQDLAHGRSGHHRALDDPT